MTARLALAAVLALALAAPARAERTAAETALAASEDLRASITALNEAARARDRVAALTRTIRAYEAGLSALRDGLRRATLREREIAARFEEKRERVARILGAMASMGQAPGPLLLLHPAGPESTARAGMVLSDVTPALQAEAEVLRAELEEIALLRGLQDSAAETLQSGLSAVQEARTALSQAMQDRTGLPRRFLEDPEELRALVESADTLEGFATGLLGMETDIGPPMEDFAGARGTLPLPVLGRVLRGFGEADAAGIRRPGLVLATEPAAVVTTPWPATIRYRGPLLDYENVMILEPADGYLLVLAGLGTVYGETGDVLSADAPVGLMGGAEPGGPEFAAGFLAAAQDGGGAGAAETLYMELRQGKEPVDPAAWFTETRKD